MSYDNTRDLNLLDQYWDARGRDGDAPDELDDTLRRSVEGFHAADDTPAPDDAFVDHLWTDLTGAASTPASASDASGWTEGPDDESPRPQFVSQRQGGRLNTKGQSTWRRRARQIGEMIAAAILLAAITGGLILAYQNLLGDSDGESGPAGEDNLVPSLESVSEIDLDPPVISMGAVQIAGQDYILSLTSTGQDDEPDGVVLRVGQLDDTGELETVSTLEAPVPWDNYLMQAGLGPIVAEDNVLYIPLVEGGHQVLWVVDIADPSAPAELAYIETDHLGPSIAVADDLLAMTGYFGGDISIYDVSDPASPEHVGTLPDSKETSVTNRPELRIEGENLYMVRSRGLSIIDLSDPSQPEQVGFFENPDWDGPEEARDIRQRSAEEMTEVLTSPGTFSDMVVAGDYAYISAGFQEILILDVSDPSSPVEAGRFERDDPTFRLERSGDYLYVLGAEAVDDEETTLRMKLSLETVDVSDRANPQMVDRVEDFVADFDSSAFALMTQFFTHGGNTFVAYGNFPSAYIAQVDWVEAPENLPEVTPSPTTEPDDSAEGLPDQDPREVAVSIVQAITDGDWDAVRARTIPEFSDRSDLAVQRAVVDPMPSSIRFAGDGTDSIDAWQAERYGGWGVVRLQSDPAVSLVLRNEDGRWLLAPGFHRVTYASGVDELGEQAAEHLLEPIELGTWTDDTGQEQTPSQVNGFANAVQSDDGVVEVAFWFDFFPAEQASISLDDLRWSAGNENGVAEIVQGTVQLVESEGRVRFPLTNERGGQHTLILRATGVPTDADEIELSIQGMNLVDVKPIRPEDSAIDAIELTGTFRVPNETTPDRNELESAAEQDPDSGAEPTIDTEDLTLEEVYRRTEESLSREDQIYHATITTDAAEDSFEQGGSTELWIDAPRNLAREESTSTGEVQGEVLTINTIGIAAEGAQHTLYDGPAGRIDGTRATSCYGASEATSALLGCPGALGRSTTTIEAGNYQGQPAVVLVTTGTTRGSDETFDFTSRLYLDPDSFIPIAEEREGDHTYGPVATHSAYEHEFIDRDSIPEDHFDPVSLAVSRLDSADVDIPIHWLGVDFAPNGDLPPIVLADGGVPEDLPGTEYSHETILSYRLPEPTFTSGNLLRSEVVIQSWSREEWDASAGPALQSHWDDRCHETVDMPLEDGQATIYMGHGEAMSPAQPGYNAPPPPETDPGECPDEPFSRFEAVAEFDEAVLLVAVPGESEYRSQTGLEAILQGLEIR